MFFFANAILGGMKGNIIMVHIRGILSKFTEYAQYKSNNLVRIFGVLFLPLILWGLFNLPRVHQSPSQ